MSKPSKASKYLERGKSQSLAVNNSRKEVEETKSKMTRMIDEKARSMESDSVLSLLIEEKKHHKSLLPQSITASDVSRMKEIKESIAAKFHDEAAEIAKQLGTKADDSVVSDIEEMLRVRNKRTRNARKPNAFSDVKKVASNFKLSESDAQKLIESKSSEVVRLQEVAAEAARLGSLQPQAITSSQIKDSILATKGPLSLSSKGQKLGSSLAAAFTDVASFEAAFETSSSKAAEVFGSLSAQAESLKGVRKNRKEAKTKKLSAESELKRAWEDLNLKKEVAQERRREIRDNPRLDNSHGEQAMKEFLEAGAAKSLAASNKEKYEQEYKSFQAEGRSLRDSLANSIKEKLYPDLNESGLLAISTQADLENRFEISSSKAAVLFNSIQQINLNSTQDSIRKELVEEINKTMKESIEGNAVAAHHGDMLVRSLAYPRLPLYNTSAITGVAIRSDHYHIPGLANAKITSLEDSEFTAKVEFKSEVQAKAFKKEMSQLRRPDGSRIVNVNSGSDEKVVSFAFKNSDKALPTPAQSQRKTIEKFVETVRDSVQAREFRQKQAFVRAGKDSTTVGAFIANGITFGFPALPAIAAVSGYSLSFLHSTVFKPIPGLRQLVGGVAQKFLIAAAEGFERGNFFADKQSIQDYATDFRREAEAINQREKDSPPFMKKYINPVAGAIIGVGVGGLCTGIDHVCSGAGDSLSSMAKKRFQAVRDSGGRGSILGVAGNALAGVVLSFLSVPPTIVGKFTRATAEVCLKVTENCGNDPKGDDAEKEPRSIGNLVRRSGSWLRDSINRRRIDTSETDRPEIELGGFLMNGVVPRDDDIMTRKIITSAKKVKNPHFVIGQSSIKGDEDKPYMTLTSFSVGDKSYKLLVGEEGFWRIVHTDRGDREEDIKARWPRDLDLNERSVREIYAAIDATVKSQEQKSGISIEGLQNLLRNQQGFMESVKNNANKAESEKESLIRNGYELSFKEGLKFGKAGSILREIDPNQPLNINLLSFVSDFKAQPSHGTEEQGSVRLPTRTSPVIRESRGSSPGRSPANPSARNLAREQMVIDAGGQVR